MKKAIAALFLLLAATTANAGPKKFFKEHGRFTKAAIALAAASVIQYEGTSYCQRGDVERCNEGYGSRRAFDWFSIGMGVGMLGASEACWKDQPGWKFCYVLAYGVPAYQTFAGVKDFASYRPEQDKTVTTSTGLVLPAYLKK
ncbi:MAG TPA: hypothetical protein VN843_29325 [Anaerolineales bacterium]|nr:hypothetical protein [Anaerolineales bacterium]